jgi:hypothetical protein
MVFFTVTHKPCLSLLLIFAYDLLKEFELKIFCLIRKLNKVHTNKKKEKLILKILNWFWIRILKIYFEYWIKIWTNIWVETISLSIVSAHLNNYSHLFSQQYIKYELRLSIYLISKLRIITNSQLLIALNKRNLS